MDEAEQLAFEVAVATRHRGSRRGTRHLWLRLGRLTAALLGGLAVAAAAVQLSPFRTAIASVPVVISASVAPSHRGLTVDSSVGNLQFRDVTALPLGLHVTPRIGLETVRAATQGGAAFSERARADLRAEVPALALHVVLAAAVGLGFGALAGGLLFDGTMLLLSNQPTPTTGRRRHRIGRAFVDVSALTLLTSVVLAAIGAGTYRPSWYTRYTVTGLLADVAATPAQLASLDARDAAAAGKLRAVLRLQDALTQPPPASAAPPSSYQILFISDVHRRNIYPYLQQYIDANDVALVVNTGDETLIGNAAELTDDYVRSIRTVTTRTPMIWVKGNHDSAAVSRAMDAIPGVTVLDGRVVAVDGLQIYGTADPRTYAASGDAGSDAPDTVTRIEAKAAAEALAGLDRTAYLDLLLAHEPVKADLMATTLGASVRAQASGHLHHQNAEGDLQKSGRDDLRLIEGSTGLGGLFANAGDPMEFSILTVAANCQFTRIVRYSLSDPALPAETRVASFGQSSSFTVHYFSRQPVAANRLCSASAGLGPVLDARSPDLHSVREWAAAATPARTDAPLASPSPVKSDDEAGDATVVQSPVPAGRPAG